MVKYKTTQPIQNQHKQNPPKHNRQPRRIQTIKKRNMGLLETPTTNTIRILETTHPQQ